MNLVLQMKEYEIVNVLFMTLSFMALLVIPSFKISDKGVFDFESFAFTDLIKQYLV
mgnify:CR=1 FL=1